MARPAVHNLYNRLYNSRLQVLSGHGAADGTPIKNTDAIRIPERPSWIYVRSVELVSWMFLSQREPKCPRNERSSRPICNSSHAMLHVRREQNYRSHLFRTGFLLIEKLQIAALIVLLGSQLNADRDLPKTGGPGTKIHMPIVECSFSVLRHLGSFDACKLKFIVVFVGFKYSACKFIEDPLGLRVWRKPDDLRVAELFRLMLCLPL